MTGARAVRSRRARGSISQPSPRSVASCTRHTFSKWWYRLSDSESRARARLPSREWARVWSSSGVRIQRVTGRKYTAPCGVNDRGTGPPKAREDTTVNENVRELTDESWDH